MASMEVDQAPVQSLAMQGILSEVSNTYKPYMEKIFDSNPTVVLAGLREIRNFIIGNNRQKSNFIVLGVISRTVYMMSLTDTDMAIKSQCAVILGSLALGSEENIKSLLHYNVLENLICGLKESDQFFYETCLRCIRSIASSKSTDAQAAVVDKLRTIMNRILKCVNLSSSTQECTCEIITACCKTPKDQEMFAEFGSVGIVCALVMSPKRRVKLRAAQALTALCYKNPQISSVLVTATYENVTLISVLSNMMSRCEEAEIQLNSACCITNMYRSGVMDESHEKLVFYKTAPCLVRMCEPGRTCKQRILGARTVAYLIESEPRLQRLVYICEHFPHKLEVFMRLPQFDEAKTPESLRKFKDEVAHHDELVTSAFLAYAALLSNEEDLRKSVASDALVKRLVEAMDSKLEEVRIASIQCLLSLSRSIQVLRTFFQNQEVWKAVLQIAYRDSVSDRETAALCALVANLLLEFSPSRNQLLDGQVLKKIMEWCKKPSSVNIRRNALYALANVTFRSNAPDRSETDTKLRVDILAMMGSETLQNLVLSDDEVTKVRTLDVMTNILSLEHIEELMTKHGDLVIQLLTTMLARSSSSPQSGGNESQAESPQVLCAVLRILRNIIEADLVKTVRDFVLQNRDVLVKIVDLCKSDNAELLNEAINCLCCLVTIEDNHESNINRLDLLRSIGVFRVLENFKTSSLVYMPEKLKDALEYF